MTDHPITPSPELVQQWLGEFFGCTVSGELSDSEKYLATQAARWGADQELEACIAWATNTRAYEMTPGALRAARRPKPPSLKELALAKLPEHPETMSTLWSLSPGDVAVVRRALEALPND